MSEQVRTEKPKGKIARAQVRAGEPRNGARTPEIKRIRMGLKMMRRR